MVPESCIVQCSRETKTSSFECPSEEVTLIQCDASQSGPGSVTVPNRKSVVYAQILKELFVVVLASDHFDAYISIMSAIARVQIETDHKSLESIMQMFLHSTPKRLQ